jgi:hypothetical protein
MYTILVTDENELRVTLKERIMQRSKLVDSFHILVDPLYKNETDMTEFTTVYMEYILPVSKKYVTENLILTSEENTEVVNEDPDFDPEIDIEEEPKEEVKAKVVPILYKGKLEYNIKKVTNRNGDEVISTGQLRLAEELSELDRIDIKGVWREIINIIPQDDFSGKIQYYVIYF